MDLGISGRVVLVTGSSRGIGLAEARLFAHEGARIAVNGVDVDRAEAAAAAIRAEAACSSASRRAWGRARSSSTTPASPVVTWENPRTR